MQGNAFTGWHTGAYINGGTDVVVENNLFDNNNVGMSLDAYVGATGLSVSGNTFTDQVVEGLGIASADGTSWSGEISGNDFTGPGVFNYDATLPGDIVEGNTFHGTVGNDTLTDDSTGSGQIGGNTLIGNIGNDILTGGEGDDILIGGLGQDTLTGDDGADVFVLDQVDIADIIADYDFLEGDKVDLSELLDQAANGITDGNKGEFVQYTNAGELQIDTDGNGDSFETVATIIDAGVSTDDLTVIIDGLEVTIQQS